MKRVVTGVIAATLGLLFLTSCQSGDSEKSGAQAARVNPVVPSPVLVETLRSELPPGDYNAQQATIQTVDAFGRDGVHVGWAGESIDNGRVQVFWKGDLPADVRDRLVQLGALPVDIYRTAFDSAELEAAQRQFGPVAFSNGGCSTSVPYGFDALVVTTASDPATLNIPTKTGDGIPVVVEFGTCISPM